MYLCLRLATGVACVPKLSQSRLLLLAGFDFPSFVLSTTVLVLESFDRPPLSILLGISADIEWHRHEVFKNLY